MGKSYNKEKEKEMTAKDYAELKDYVIGLNNIELYNLFEILIDEMNYRKMKTEKETKDAN